VPHLAPLRKIEWVVYPKPPIGGPNAVLAYLSRYTHRIAIANSRLVAFDGERVIFKWNDYGANSAARYKAYDTSMPFICRFLIQVLPHGFHRSVRLEGRLWAWAGIAVDGSERPLWVNCGPSWIVRKLAADGWRAVICSRDNKKGETWGDLP
jgi:hypothetical protein